MGELGFCPDGAGCGGEETSSYIWEGCRAVPYRGIGVNASGEYNVATHTMRDIDLPLR
jgi:hypothetical protein